jgi:hypothetical protein
VCVVDHTHDRLLLGCLGQHRQGRDPYQERLDLPRLLSERDPESARLRLRKPFGQTEDRSEQPVQRRERQRGLRLQALGAQHPHVAQRRQGLRQESRLPHAGFAVHHEAAGRPCAGLLDERGQASQLHRSPMQHAVTVPRDSPARPPSLSTPSRPIPAL